MYQKPKLERFGTLRELTLLGVSPDCDGGPAMGNGSSAFCDTGGGSRS